MKCQSAQRCARFLWLLAFCVGAARPLVAQAQTARTAERTLIREGRRLLVAGRPEEALARFRVAFDLGRTTTALAHMGVAHGALGRFVDAEDCLRRALEAPPDELMEHDWLPRFQENLRVAQRQVGMLAIEANVDGAVITANGQRVGQTPLRETIRLPIGRVLLTASATDRPTIEREIVLTGGPIVVQERFVFAAPTPQPAVTRVVGARVSGVRVAQVPAGVPPSVASSGPWAALAASSAAVTVVGVTMGAVGLGIAQYNAGQYREGECGMPDDVPECALALTLGGAATITSGAGWSLAALGAIGTIVFARTALSSPRPAATRAWVMPVLNGAAIFGQF